jgi:hypothetical protein
MQLALWTMLEGFVSIANILEEMDLILSSEHSGTQAVNGSISPSLFN